MHFLRVYVIYPCVFVLRPRGAGARVGTALPGALPVYLPSRGGGVCLGPHSLARQSDLALADLTVKRRLRCGLHWRLFAYTRAGVRSPSCSGAVGSPRLGSSLRLGTLSPF